MKRNNVALCLFVSLVVLAMCTIFIELPNRVAVAISLSSLMYTFAQSLKNTIDLLNEDTKAQIDTFNTIGNFNMDAANLIFMKRFALTQTPPKKVKNINRASGILECAAFVILLGGITIPIPALENETIGDVATMLSFAFLFLSMWQIEKYSERKSQWEELVLLYMAMKKTPEQKTEEVILDAHS